MDKILKADYYGDLKIGKSNVPIPCAVLEDETRVLFHRSVATSLGVKGSGGYWKKKKADQKGALMPEFVSAKYLQLFIDEETRVKLCNPISYRTKTGVIAEGIDATLLPEICDIWMKADQKGALNERQQKIAINARILLKGLAHIGIVALVDEATGYQDVRNREVLQVLLEKFLEKEFAAWAKRFPDEFYKQMFRLRAWPWRGMSSGKPRVVGKYTNDIVYARLAPGILTELKKRNPPDRRGRRKARFQQFLTEDIGHPALAQHLHAVIALMRASTTWRGFYSMLQRALPKKGEGIQLEFDE